MICVRMVIFFSIFICKTNCHPSLNGRIVGGITTNVNEFPHQLSLRYRGSHICGASILNERHVLTAAHCVVGKSAEDFSIYAGTSFSNRGIPIKVQGIAAHQNYNSNTSNFDIAIIKVLQEFKFNATIQPVVLPVENEVIEPGTDAVVSGWGYTKESATSVSTILQKVLVTVIELRRCRILYRGKGVVTNRMLCAGLLHGGRDACQGDSGGPLTAKGKLIGIVSWGYGCARPGYPGVYTRVALFIKWITRVLQRGI